MSKGRTNGMNQKHGIVKKLRKSLLLGKKFRTDDDNQPENESRDVPEDVKEGHFAVIATDDDELKRFVVPLSCLTHPLFLRLLEQAAEVYGFDHEANLATSTLDFLDSRRFTYQNQVSDRYLNDKARISSVYLSELQWRLMISDTTFITHISRRRNFRLWWGGMVKRQEPRCGGED
ncbi:hypothetical protein HAX54_026213 [Datura stramonium]|uniref:Uncharacterized protein n=1 Tax=Datura stramonium TaxID=4076 RepID=A0ABS8S6X4_DATST|nr:hypothetical protein [Datura stramonium]